MDADQLRELKEQLRLDDTDSTAEDALLARLHEQARLMVLNQLGYATERYKAMPWAELPADLRGVILMEAGHLYEQRESSTSVNTRVDEYCLSVINHYTQLIPEQP